MSLSQGDHEAEGDSQAHQLAPHAPQILIAGAVEDEETEAAQNEQSDHQRRIEV
jgi:hypothetical protein